jgi:hypothetical protein
MVIGNADHVETSLHKAVYIMVGHPEDKTLGGVFAFLGMAPFSGKCPFQVPEGDVRIPERAGYIGQEWAAVISGWKIHGGRIIGPHHDIPYTDQG